MESRNPVFARADGFNGKQAATAYPGYSDPSQWGVGTPGGAPATHATGVDQGPMTIDSVVQKTGITLGVVVVAAAITWIVTGDINSESALAGLYGLSLIGALGGFALSLVNSFKKVVSPALVLAYAAFEGVFVGAFSKAIEGYVTTNTNGDPGGIVFGAVIGTVAAFVGTLAAYKFFNIKVGQRFRTWVIGALFGFLALSVLDFVLGFFHASFGFNGIGGWGLVASVAGLGLGVLMLILDFDMVERGIAARLPERESWRAAFGLTVTLVFIYIQIVRILASLRSN